MSIELGGAGPRGAVCYALGVRIAVLTTSYPRHAGDPSGHFVRAEVDALRAKGHEVRVLAPGSDRFAWPGVAARLSRAPWQVPLVWRDLRTLSARINGETNVDRIVAHWAWPAGWIAARSAHRVPIELVSHGADVRWLSRLPSPVRTRVVGVLLDRASEWRFVSSALLGDLCARLPHRLATKVRMKARIAQPKLAWPALQPKRYLREAYWVSVGRLIASKGVDRAILYAARRASARALVVVGDGPERPALERLAEREGADVRFLGLVPREDALRAIRDADALLMASEAEGCSTVLREAEHFGTRVIDLRPGRVGVDAQTSTAARG